jgi:hypothetical protein
MGATGFFLLGAAGDPRSFAPELLLSIACTGAATYVCADALHRRQRQRRVQERNGWGDARSELHEEELKSPLLAPDGR